MPSAASAGRASAAARNAAPPRAGLLQRAPAAHLACIAALMLMHVLPYAWGAVAADSARDLYMATQLVDGIAMPRVGPRVADVLHLSPLWFYLVALPVALSKSVAATFCFVGLLAAAKFPAAYALGRALQSRGLGLAIAAALAIPGWKRLQPALPTHTNLIEACMLGALWALARLERGGGSGWWLAYFLLQGLALQAHPAAAIVAPFALVVLWRRGWPALRADGAHLAAGVLLPLAMFLPALLDQAAPLGPHLNRIVAQAGALGVGRETMKLLGGLARAWLHPLGAQELSPALGVAMDLLRQASAAAACAMLAVGLARDRGVRLAALALLAACFMMVLMRDRTPYYMSYALLPFVALLVGVAWWRTARLGRAGRIVAGSFALLAGTLALAAPALHIAGAERGNLTFAQGRIGNIREASAPHVGALLPALRFDAWGAQVCARREPVTLHGDLAFFVDAGLALSVHFQCGRRDLVTLGSAEGTHHVAGLMPDQRARLGLAAGWEHVFSDAPLQAFGPQRAETPAPGGLLALRPPRDNVEPAEREYRFTARRDEVVSLALLFGYHDGSGLGRVTADGVLQEPVFRGAATAFHRCAACSGERVIWEVTMANGDVSSLDVTVLPAAATPVTP